MEKSIQTNTLCWLENPARGKQQRRKHSLSQSSKQQDIIQSQRIGQVKKSFLLTCRKEWIKLMTLKKSLMSQKNTTTVGETIPVGRIQVTIQPCGNFLEWSIPEKHRNVLSCQMTLMCSSDITTSNLLNLLQTCGITKESIRAELKVGNLCSSRIQPCPLFSEIHKLGLVCPFHLK